MIDLTNVKHIYVACGFTDLRKGIDGYINLADGNLQIINIIQSEQLKLERSRRFAKKSEKTEKEALNYKQYTIFDEILLLDDSADVVNEAENIQSTMTEEEKVETETITYTRRKKKNKVNQNLDNIEVRVVEHKLPDSECFCKTCGTKLNDIGYTEVRRFEYIPTKIVAT